MQRTLIHSFKNTAVNSWVYLWPFADYTIKPILKILNRHFEILYINRYLLFYTKNLTSNTPKLLRNVLLNETLTVCLCFDTVFSNYHSIYTPKEMLVTDDASIKRCSIATDIWVASQWKLVYTTWHNLL